MTNKHDYELERQRFIEAVQRGLEDVKNGRLITHEELVIELDIEFGENNGLLGGDENVT